jgi:hypothetical protein
VDPLHDSALDPILDPILEATLLDPVLDAVLDSVVDPVLDSPLDSIRDQVLDPILDPALDPILDPALDPVLILMLFPEWLHAHWPLAVAHVFPALRHCATGSRATGVPQGPYLKGGFLGTALPLNANVCA